jgi:hypothetical protein
MVPLTMSKLQHGVVVECFHYAEMSWVLQLTLRRGSARAATGESASPPPPATLGAEEREREKSDILCPYGRVVLHHGQEKPRLLVVSAPDFGWQSADCKETSNSKPFFDEEA